MATSPTSLNLPVNPLNDGGRIAEPAMSSPDRPPGAPRIFIQAPTPPTYTLADHTITLPFPLSLDVLDRLLFRAAIEYTGNGRAAARLIGRSSQWAYTRCFELDIPRKNW